MTDARRTAFDTDFTLTNSGGLRTPLTCPIKDIPNDFCASNAPANAITRGQVFSTLPFGNVAVTAEISGISPEGHAGGRCRRRPGATGGFPQISGLCFAYDITRAPGSRVVNAVRQADDGTCSGKAIEFIERTTDTIATNDFTAADGDTYPDISGRAYSRDVHDQLVAAYISFQGTVNLEIQGRITCTGEGCPAPTS